MIDRTDYNQFVVPLDKNNLVGLYTDSLIETRNSDRIMLSEEGLRQLIGQLNARQPQTIAGDLATALDAYRGGATPDDDQTIMVLHHNAAEPPKQTLSKKLKSIGKMVGLISH